MFLGVLVQQLGVQPVPAAVGEPIEVRVSDQVESRSVPRPGVEVVVVLPDAQRRPCGASDANGAVGFVAQQIGRHVFEVRHDDHVAMAPIEVVPERRRWLAAFVTVPLGLLLVWRALVRRAVPLR